MNILEELAQFAYIRTEQAKKKITLTEIKKQAYELPKGDFSFEHALNTPKLSFICECKKASPSKGVIVEHFPYLDIAREYESAGADCISVLTEPKWFFGEDRYLKDIVANVTIPCLRKDFIVDEYMIYDSKLLGASAILLICSILTANQIADYIQICDSLGLSTLVEAHDQNEVETALHAGARIIGVNNRDLRDFSINADNSRMLRKIVPPDVLFVSESGIKNSDDVKQLIEIGVDAVLIGETLMRASDKKQKLWELRGQIN